MFHLKNRIWAGGFLVVAATFPALITPAPAEAQVLWGYLSGEQYGFSVAWAGDIDDDGKDDFLVGSPTATTARGQVELYLGRYGYFPRTPDAVYEGETQGDYLGYAVSTAGDVNHDGYDDFLIGAPGHDAGGLNTGRIYLYLGGNNPPSAPVRSWDGDLPNGRLGASLAGGFDFNKDGRDDFAAGAPDRTDTDGGGGLRAGQVRLFLGAASPAQITQPFAFTGDQPNWQLGFSLDAAGDIDKDGYGDLVAGAPQRYDANAGRAVVWFGQASSIFAPSRFVFVGVNGADRFGWDVSGAGDVNGDGYGDLLVGAPAHDGNALDDGAAYLFRGGSFASMDASPDWSATGAAGQDSLGYAVDGGFDFSGDGVPDIIAGAPGADAPGSGSGEVLLYYNASTPHAAADLVIAPTAPVSSFEANDRFGASVRFVGSFNGAATAHDARAEFVAGAPSGNSTAGSASGYVDFVFDVGSYVPVRVIAFTAEPVAGGVEIRWELAETESFARLLLEADRDGTWTTIHVGWLAAGTREFLDANPAPGRVEYRLSALERTGSVTVLASTAIEVRPARVALRSPQGGLFRDVLRVDAVFPRRPGSLAVIDARGRVVRTLAENAGPGPVSASWDGLDGTGASSPSGVYFVRASAGDEIVALRVVRIR